MKLEKEIAMKIINEVKNLTDENIIIINSTGTIIASTDNSRINDYHEGADIVIQSREKLYIDSNMSTKLEGVKPGINLPIVFDNQIIGVIGITGLPNEIEPFADLFRRMTELIVREAYYMEKKEWETRGLESFFYDWVYSDNLNDSLLNKGEIYGISFNTPYLCIIFEFTQNDSYDEILNVQRFMEKWFKQFFSQDQKDFFIPWGHGRYLIIKKQETENDNKLLENKIKNWKEELYKLYGIKLAVGVGKNIEKKSISRSYQEALKSLNVAKKNYTIIFYEDLLLDILTGDVNIKTKQEYVSKVLTPLKDNEELFHTLEAYLNNNQSLKKTADVLHIHLNTLNYRLKKIYELTDINPKEIEGMTILYLAIFLSDKQI